MSARRLICLAAFAMMCLPALPVCAGAAADAPGPQSWAVIVGVNKYGSSIQSLACPSHDAHRVFTLLTDPRCGKIPKDHVALLTSDAEDLRLRPTRDNIQDALEGLAGRARKEDSFWFYFSGHGSVVDGASYLLPADTKVSNITGSALPARLVRETLERCCQDGRRIVVLDACHSGSAKAVRARLAVPDAPPAGDTPAAGDRGLANLGTVTLAACGVDEMAFEFPDLPGSAFTHFLVRGLMGEADQDRNRAVDMAELQSFVTTNVQRMLRQRHGEGLTQTPVFLIPPVARDLVIEAPPPDQVALLPAVAEDEKLGEREPLGPVVAVVVRETRVMLDGRPMPGKAGGIAEAEIRKLLVRQGFPVVEPEAVRELSAALAGDDKAEAARQAAKVGARFLIVGRAETQASKLALTGDFVHVQATLALDLVDQGGRVWDSEQVGADEATPLTGSDITELGAATQALRAAAGQVVGSLLPRAAKVLGVKPTGPPQDN